MLEIEVEIEGITELLQHKFNGLDEEKRIKELSNEEQAKKHLYMSEDGILYFPSEWMRYAIIDTYIRRAGNKQKTAEKLRVSPAIRIFPAEISLGTKDYIIDVRSVPCGNMSRGGVRDFCVRPKIPIGWKAKFIIQSGLNDDLSDVKDILEEIGERFGIGSNRVNGYGRFKVTSINKKWTDSRLEKMRVEKKRPDEMRLE